LFFRQRAKQRFCLRSVAGEGKIAADIELHARKKWRIGFHEVFPVKDREYPIFFRIALELMQKIRQRISYREIVVGIGLRIDLV
jgi:hypothetical protein